MALDIGRRRRRKTHKIANVERKRVGRWVRLQEGRDAPPDRVCCYSRLSIRAGCRPRADSRGRPKLIVVEDGRDFNVDIGPCRCKQICNPRLVAGGPVGVNRAAVAVAGDEGVHGKEGGVDAVICFGEERGDEGVVGKLHGEGELVEVPEAVVASGWVREVVGECLRFDCVDLDTVRMISHNRIEEYLPSRPSQRSRD